jgi:hypothetical protein
MIQRIFMLVRMLVGARILVLERKYNRKRGKDGLTLYGTIHDKPEQIHMLRTMAASLECELTLAEQQELATLQ